MPFKSRKQFYYLMREHPDIWKEWVAKYGVRGLGVGSKSKWMKINPQEYLDRSFKSREQFFWMRKNKPQEWLKILEEQGLPESLGLGSADKWTSRGFESESSPQSIKEIVNSITFEDLQKRYYEFLREINQQGNKEGDFNISGGEQSFYPTLLKKYLKQKGITAKSTKINCPNCIKEGYGKTKLEYQFFEELDDYELGDFIWTIKNYFKKTPKTVYWNYCYDCGKDIKIPKEQIREMYGEEVWNYLSKIVDDETILMENFDETVGTQFKIYKKDINPAKKKLIKGIETEGNKVKIYRALTAKKDWLDKPTKKNSIMNRGLGIYWSFDKKQAKNYFHESQRAKYIRDYRIYALADFDEIDWALTILLNSSDWEHENEIRIIKGSPLDILEIEGQDKWYKPLDISGLPTKEIKASEVFEAYKPPQAAVNNAKRGLKLREKWGRGGLSPAEAKKQGIDSGVTRAKKIASGSVSRHDVRRMSAFNRHRKNYNPSKKKPDGGPTAGTIAWLLWGGTSGVDWAKKKSAAMNAEEYGDYNKRGICDKVAISETKKLLSQGIDDFFVIEGYVWTKSADTNEWNYPDPHTWIKLNDGTLIDPSERQYDEEGGIVERIDTIAYDQNNEFYKKAKWYKPNEFLEMWDNILKGAESWSAEEIKTNLPQHKVKTIQAGIEIITEDLRKPQIDMFNENFLRGQLKSYQDLLNGIKITSGELVLEEISWVLSPKAEELGERAYQANNEEMEHYYMGMIYGYDFILDLFGEFPADFQREMAAESIDIDIEIEDATLTRKEVKMTMWYPLMVGFIGGTLANIASNYFTVYYLRKREII